MRYDIRGFSSQTIEKIISILGLTKELDVSYMPDDTAYYLYTESHLRIGQWFDMKCINIYDQYNSFVIINTNTRTLFDFKDISDICTWLCNHVEQQDPKNGYLVRNITEFGHYTYPKD